MKKVFPHRFYDNVLGYNLHVWLNCTEKEALFNADCNPDLSDENNRGCCFYRPNTWDVHFWFKDKKPDVGIIVHEAYHGLTQILRAKGITGDYYSEEFYACYIEFLVKNILKAIKDEATHSRSIKEKSRIKRPAKHRRRS